MCRRASGAAFLTWVGFSTDLVRFDAIAPSTYCSSEAAVRGFCATCGSTLSMQYRASPHVLDLALGTLDKPALVAPMQHIWWAEALPWTALRDGLPHHYLRGSGSSLAD